MSQISSYYISDREIVNGKVPENKYNSFQKDWFAIDIKGFRDIYI